MKKLILMLMFGSLFMGCFIMHTKQNLSKSSKVQAGMTTDGVLKIMGEPVISELDRNVEEWHYCTTGSGDGDSFVALFFVDNQIIAKKQYNTDEGLGSCEKFVKMGTYEVPFEVQNILNKKNN